MEPRRGPLVPHRSSASERAGRGRRPGAEGRRRTVEYPAAHNVAMLPLRPLRYITPRPPTPDSVAINQSRATVPILDWRLPRAVRLRLSSPSAAPHSALVAVWSCPVCEVPVPRRHRPGRHRVYCTNACRQRAYRQRCVSRRAQPMSAHRDPRPTRAATRDRVHAVRECRDVLSGRRDSIGRGVTACGAFARLSIDTPERFGHVRFLPARHHRNATTCRRCEALTGPADESVLTYRAETDPAA